MSFLDTYLDNFNDTATLTEKDRVLVTFIEGRMPYSLRLIFDSFRRKSNRNGVETRISQGTFEKSLHAANVLVITLTRNLVPTTSFFSSRVVCMASSRAGHKKTARTPPLLGNCTRKFQCYNAGYVDFAISK